MGPVASDAPIETRLFINGEFVPSKSGKTFEVKNPATLKHVAHVSEAGVEDVDIAVEAAKAAFPAWSSLAAMERQGWLYKLADAFDAELSEISRLEALSMGKPTYQDVSAMGTAIMRYQVGKAYDIQGETSLHTPGFVNMTFRQPYVFAVT
jgi:aldehyde dehydrogenase (NAD+)